MDADPSTLAPDLIDTLTAQQDAMLDVLEQLVRAESPTNRPEAQAEVQGLLQEALADLSFAVQFLPVADYGDPLYARPAHRSRTRPVQLLVGHTDTVWPSGTLDDMPFEVDDNVVRGPGVFDMKGGLTQMVFALRALDAAGVSPSVTPVVFINADEEVGSPESRRHLHRLAPIAHRAFVLEPALGTDGKIKTARKGGGHFVVRIRGKSAHAGLDPESGSSAILELSHVVQQLHALNDPEAGVSVNVGTIGGGTRPNVVAAESRAEVDLRVATKAQAETVTQAIRDLEATTPGTTLEIEGGVRRPPMERTPASRRLWAQAQQAAGHLGIGPLKEGRSGGSSDGNIIAQYTPTLDGMGAVGDGAHARHEFCYADKMVERSALLALLIAQPPLPGFSNGTADAEDIPATDRTTSDALEGD
jgi:glutamate carboxypeptidase